MSSNGNATLPLKQQRFVDLLFVHEFNATKAYAEAYGVKETSARRTASRLLTNVDISRAIHKRAQKLSATTEVTVERVLLELKRMAYVDIGEAYDETGALKPLKAIPEDVRRAIVGIETVEKWEEDAEGKPFLAGHVKKVKFADKRGSNELLGKYLKMFVERHEFGLTDDLLEALQAGRQRVANAR